MTYVPVVPSAPPSPRASELGSRLEEVINAFRAENPGLTDLEIRQAVDLATSGAGKTQRTVMLVVSIWFLALGFLVFFFARQGGQFDSPTFILAITAAVGIFLIVLTAVLRNS